MRAHQLIEDRVGEKLNDAQVFVHYFNEAITSLISYKLIFGTNNIIVISIGAEGDSLKVDSNDLIENDLDEYGSTRLLPVSQYDPAAINRCLGRRLNRCRMTAGPDKIFAIELHFEGIVVAFCNIDDDMAFGALVCLDKPPPARIIEFPRT